MGRIVLASASRTRIRLLENAGLSFEARAALIDERAVERPLLERKASPAEIAGALATAKAVAVSAGDHEALVVGADQVLHLPGSWWHKPSSIDAAKAQLRALSGKIHSLYSAVVVVRAGTVLWDNTDKARLKMRSLSEADIDGHLARLGEAALASVGAYEIEGPGVRLFEWIDGDYFTILGLPLLPLLAFLRQAGEIDP